MNALTSLPALQAGDRIKSHLAGRLGVVVKVYGDGSACILWDDGSPQPEGMGHERVPRKFLVVESSAAVGQGAASSPSVPVASAIPMEFLGGALAFKKALLNLRAMQKKCIAENDGNVPAGDFYFALLQEFAKPAPGNETAGFWMAFAVWLGLTLEGACLFLDGWDVVSDLEPEGGAA